MNKPHSNIGMGLGKRTVFYHLRTTTVLRGCTATTVRGATTTGLGVTTTGLTATTGLGATMTGAGATTTAVVLAVTTFTGGVSTTTVGAGNGMPTLTLTATCASDFVDIRQMQSAHNPMIFFAMIFYLR